MCFVAATYFLARRDRRRASKLKRDESFTGSDDVDEKQYEDLPTATDTDPDTLHKKAAITEVPIAEMTY